ncbi:MAG: hypothetical protein UV61_C0005G0015 [Candidatus Gottesmanbacteria bacterium GW2011_GWB1_43_11]|uniref:Uncharacterized protein n=1 Tax=Candidatus Gottesmanbacteria bacterium GW2011_GWB1_43_11 TaxID=1618446 RepID=A0A0G1CN70_9BACT|nr:MAG: hypothetical protein UV04_C0010G0015 [Candidatus Gottesmanbacteria bacterium GW2011_GWA2_42_16]KKS55906.1 MAG: hypothetical protein UV17_C0005G0015 [Candidatus Gottesmanbacteria bacterium GW2011_GWA1_42_26]KKS86994.1 MAG: hypothetical protein UV61_C0005G0015 [Candidatus Gottesmanbacteria bacterium GW2011_GWB1_43_11]OGG07814.1 MAG: hypothetical protein A2699_04575 [Candidatus Gottesmanbacteria bacterium RIFCSPHIGHO2_01_FULL_43_15]OGG28134.1 MAG: hypothetical protein A3A59_00710 [Candidat
MEASNHKLRTGNFRINFPGLRTVIRNPAISSSAKVVYVDLLLYAGIDGISFPTEATLGRNQALSDRQIRNLINELRDHNQLFWNKNSFSASNAYRFNPEIYFRIDENNRKSPSDDSGNGVPIDTGNQFPPKVVNENNQLSSSHVLQIFEDTFKRKCSKSDRDYLHKLCQNYTPNSVEESIKEVAKRPPEFVSPPYLKTILEDWKFYGKPELAPIFKPCRKNGCENGVILNKTSQTYTKCNCFEVYEAARKSWNENSKRSITRG